MKTLRFFYRYLTQSRRVRGLLRGAITIRSAMFVLISIVFFYAITVTTLPSSAQETHAARIQPAMEHESSLAFAKASRAQILEAVEGIAPLEVLPQADDPQTLTQTPAPTVTRTPLPAAYLTNDTQSVGITLTAAVLVMVVVIGVLMFMPRKEEIGGKQ